MKSFTEVFKINIFTMPDKTLPKLSNLTLGTYMVGYNLCLVEWFNFVKHYKLLLLRLFIKKYNYSFYNNLIIKFHDKSYNKDIYNKI